MTIRREDVVHVLKHFLVLSDENVEEAADRLLAVDRPEEPWNYVGGAKAALTQALDTPQAFLDQPAAFIARAQVLATLAVHDQLARLADFLEGGGATIEFDLPNPAPRKQGPYAR